MGRWVGGTFSDTALGTFVFKRCCLYKISEISLIELHFEIVFIVNEICGVCKLQSEEDDNYSSANVFQPTFLPRLHYMQRENSENRR